MSVSTADILKHLINLSGGSGAKNFVLFRKDAELPGVPEVLDTPQGTWTVCEPRTELALRRMLWKTQGAPLLALIDEKLASRLPPDLVRRGRGERILEHDPALILELALGRPVVPPSEPHIQRLAMRHAERIQRQMDETTLPTVIDRRLLDELLSNALLGTNFRSTDAGVHLASWIRTRPDWLEDPDMILFAKQVLEQYHGVDGRVLGWALDSPHRLQDIVVHGALLQIDEEVPRSAWGPFAELARAFGLSDELVRKRVIALAERALEDLGPSGDALLKMAENRGRRDFASKMLARSRLLPLGLENRMEELAQRLGRFEDIPAEELEALRHHRAVSQKETELQTLEEMARLVRFILDVAPSRAGEDVAEEGAAALFAQVRGYQRSGAFADLAATRLRRHLAGSLTFAGPARKVLDRWREVRDRQNEQFARSLSRGYLAALKSGLVVPLHRVWTEIALKPKRSLYVIVLDGCSYPVFLELLEALSSHSQNPIGLTSSPLPEEVRSGWEGAGIPALAPLPTITSHARSAFFLGEIPKDPLLAETVWREQRERTSDPGRFNQNGALASRSRKLFLKGDLADHGMKLATALADPSLEIVTAVFNAVDDQIGSSNTGATVRVAPSDIVGFLPSLKVALDAGRLVLITADHGHTPFVAKEHRTGEGPTARFRELGPAEPAPPGFLEIELQGTGGTDGRKAFAWKMGAYQGSPQVGFHGGCSLEEMVIPLAWLEREGVAADEPTWWRPSRAMGLGEAPSEAKAPDSREKRPPKRDRPSTGQTDLFVKAPPSPSIGAVPVNSGARLSLPIEVLGRLEPIEVQVLELLAENTSARSSELAARVGRQPARFDGFMTKLQRKLHEAQAPRFRSETLQGGEKLYTWVAPEASR